MKEKKTIKEYKRGLRLILKWTSNEKNKKAVINAWAVATEQEYEAGIQKWKEIELKNVDRKSRKTMTMYRALHRRAMWTD